MLEKSMAMDDNDQKLRQIVIGCQEKDDQAFSELVDMFSSQLYAYFYRLCGNNDTSNDLLSEMFLKLVVKIKTYRGGSFKKWLFTVASNVFYDYLRVEYRHKKIYDAKKEQLAFERPQHLDTGSQLKDELQLYLDRLEPETAEIIILRYFSQMSFKELAELRGEPIGTTLAKVHRGLKKLRQLMERSDG